MDHRRHFLKTALASAIAGRVHAQSPGRHSFGYKGENWLLDGAAFVIRSGSLHYPRVPRPYWRDRMRKMKSLGLNTLCTYVFWNLHEPEPGRFDFSANLDLAEYLRTAQSEGLWVLLRPGPYICSEWDFGGMPGWLLATPDIKVRSADPRFLAAAERYIKRVGQEAAGLQVARGGPILMVQVENEYGSYGNDMQYKSAVRRMIVEAGFDGQLYTSDGSGRQNLEGGTFADLPAAINFGDQNNPEHEFANFANFRSSVPRFCAEYWPGWFDHWGELHHTTPATRSANAVDWMLSRNISFNLYMVHGGTNFGFMAGANLGRDYEPTISAYDYDAPIDEAGRPTEKFRTIQAAIRKRLPAAAAEFPPLPAPLPLIAIPRFELKQSAALTSRLPKPIDAERPMSMEAAGQSYGFILYRKQVKQPVKGTIEIGGMHDYAVVSQGKRHLGTLDRRKKQERLEVELSAGEPLDLLVENMGRSNFGPLLVTERKGITGRVTVNGTEWTGWEVYPLPMTDAARWPFAAKTSSGPALYRGTFTVASPGDSFLDLRGWGHGMVWVNGHCLGRYWKIGPQQTLFLPAPWLEAGENEAIVLDLEDGGKRSLEGLTDPVYETPRA
jgi:beta-galactosidase